MQPRVSTNVIVQVVWEVGGDQIKYALTLIELLQMTSKFVRLAFRAILGIKLKYRYLNANKRRWHVEIVAKNFRL